MPDNSGRPDLKQIAEDHAARRQPTIVIGTGSQPEIPPGDTFVPVFRQPSIPRADGPYVWLKTDPVTDETTDILEQA